MSNFNETKRQQLEANKAQKQKEYEDTAEALRVTLNPGDKSKLKRALDGLEAEIRQIEAELARLDQAPVHSPADSSSIQRPRPFMAEALPPDFVARPAEFEAITRSLIHADQGTVAITAALKGAGGYGKTTLARAVCHDRDVWGKFTEGVLWVTLGEKVTENDLIAKVLDLVVALTDVRPNVVTLEAAKNELKEAVGERALLLTVDDVWQAGHALPFLNLGGNMAVLITTRDSNTLPSYAIQHNVDAMQPSEAVQLLQAGLPAGEIHALTTLAKRLGEWPLLLKLANGQLRKRMRGNQTLPQALNWVNRALTEKGFNALNDPGDPVERNRAAAISLGLSLGLLEAAQRDKFERLAVFPEDEDIPFVTLEKLWGLGEFDVEDLGQRCADLSLLLRFDLGARVIRLHDVVRTYLCEVQSSDLPAKHAAFLETYKIEDWHTLPADEPYLWRWLGYHLRAAGQRDTLRGLLLDFNFLQAKLNATDANTLIADFDGLTDDDEPLRLIESAISIIAHWLDRDKTNLVSQIVGRLIRYKNRDPQISAFLESAYQFSDAVLVPQSPVLSQAGGNLIRTLPLRHSGEALALTNDGEHIIVAYGAQIRVLKWRTGEIVTDFSQHIYRVTSLATQGELAFSASLDRTVKVWNWTTGELLTNFTQHTGTIYGITVQGELAFSASLDRTVKVWNWTTGELLTNFTQHKDTVYGVAVQSDLAFSASGDSTVKVWNWTTGEVLTDFTHHVWVVRGVSVQGELAFSASWDKTVKVWNWTTGQLLTDFMQHEDSVNKVSVQGEFAFSASDDKTVKVWRWARGELVTVFSQHADDVNEVKVQGEFAFSISEDRTVKVWRWSMEDPLSTFAQHTSHITSVSIQGDLVFSADDDGIIEVWQWPTSKLIARFIEHKVTAITHTKRSVKELRHDGQRRNTSKPSKTFIPYTGWVNSVCVQGELAFSASDDRTVKVWRWATGEVITDFNAHTDSVNSVCVQGELAFSASDDRTVKVWRWATGEVITDFNAHTDSVNSVSVQGELAFSTSYDETVKVWQWASGEVLNVLNRHIGPVYGVVVKGELAFSTSYDRTVKAWNWRTGKVITMFTADAPLTSVALESRERILLVGDRIGNVHVLRVVGLDHLLFPDGEE